MRYCYLIFWNDAKLSEIRKDNLCRFAYPGYQGIMVNLKPAQDRAIRIKADKGIDEVIYGILNIYKAVRAFDTSSASIVNKPCHLPETS